MGGVREDEDWTLRVDTGEYSPWLGESYQSFSRLGLAFQRSQNGGRVNAQAGPSVAYYKRLASTADAGGRPTRETSFFDGIDTSIPGLFSALGRPAPAGAPALLTAIDAEVRAAVAAFTMRNPSASVPALARGLAATRKAISAVGAEPDAVFVLQVKERQFMDAINAALGVDFDAVASTGPVVPGQTVDVRATFTNRGAVELDLTAMTLVAAAGGPDWRLPSNDDGAIRLARMRRPAIPSRPPRFQARGCPGRTTSAPRSWNRAMPFETRRSCSGRLRRRRCEPGRSTPSWVFRSRSARPSAAASRICHTATSCAS